jgi:hypothetical protein
LSDFARRISSWRCRSKRAQQSKFDVRSIKPFRKGHRKKHDCGVGVERMHDADEPPVVREPDEE